MLKGILSSGVFVVLSVFLAESSAHAWNAKAGGAGFLPIDNGKQIYVEYTPPVEGKPTVVILNGLTYKVRSWDFMVPFIAKTGVGVLRIDPVGQGWTLLKYAPIFGEIPIQNQVEDLKLILDKLTITEPVWLLGFSYGGGWSLAFTHTYPERVKGMILMAPFVAALPRDDAWVKQQVELARARAAFNPYDPVNFMTDDQLYDYFLRQEIYTFGPISEPSLLENPFKLEATFRLTQGIRKMVVADFLPELADRPIHLIVADNDQYVPREMMDGFWNSLNANKKVSRINIAFSEHKMPEAVPVFAASWVNLILAGDTRLSMGTTFQGRPDLGTAAAGNVIVPVKP